MGRKNKLKKKTPKEGHPPHQEGFTRTYLKVKAVFKCSGEKCNKRWTSVHAWERNEKIFCDICDGKAKVVDYRDEICELANYNCEKPSCGGKHWQSIHNGETWRTENCDICESSVLPNGTQKRFGRHFWFMCTSQGCEIKWEDFSLEPQKTQRCNICKSRGDIIGSTKIRENYKKMGKGEGWGHSGEHNYECCDMCQDLKSQGKANPCLEYRKAHYKIEKQPGGEYTETIIWIK